MKITKGERVWEVDKDLAFIAAGVLFLPDGTMIHGPFEIEITDIKGDTPDEYINNLVEWAEDHIRTAGEDPVQEEPVHGTLESSGLGDLQGGDDVSEGAEASLLDFPF